MGTEPFKKEYPQWGTGMLVPWSALYSLVYQGRDGVVAGNTGRKTGKNLPRQGVYAMLRSLDCIH